MTPRRRAGAPGDLVTAPLVYGLDAPPVSDRLELSIAAPLELARRLDEGALDLALLPATEIARRAGTVEVVPGLAVAGEGKSGALLHLRVPLEEVTRIVSTAPGHAAELLAATLFAAGGRPVAIEPWPGSLESALVAHGAVLIAGDDALRWEPPVGRRDPRVLDLGAAWKELTGQPVVWWAWAARPGSIDRHTYALLHAARTRARRDLDAIAARAPDRGIALERARDGLNSADYRLGRRQLEGGKALVQAAWEHGLLRQPMRLTFLPLGAAGGCPAAATARRGEIDFHRRVTRPPFP
jgi:chorismate dehydratase